MKTSIRISLFAVVMMMTAMSFTLLPLWPTWSSSHGYSIKFPGGPTSITPKVSAGLLAGEIVIHQAPGMPVFKVDYEKKRGGPYTTVANVIIDKVNKYATANGGTVTWITPGVILWKGCQSREATVQNTSGFRANIKVAILGDECWLLIAENNGALAPAADWTQFINSFQH